ncbi:hypothetical protein GF371_05535 [Candidatus Woesearchaeota archaeon]|nr:hypothetical protein [Candidatus Woesearchaeota archaeon]
MNKKLVIVALFVVIAVIAAPIAVAQCYTTTTVYFNVGTLISFTLTLPGQSPVSCNSTGAATAAIEFNSTNGTVINVDPSVVGGTAQSNGVPIFVYDNTGTTNINLSTYLNLGLPACMNLTGATTFAGADNGAVIDNSTNTTVVNSYAPAAGTQDWYMKVDFNNCTASDTTSRTLTSQAIQT